MSIRNAPGGERTWKGGGEAAMEDAWGETRSARSRVSNGWARKRTRHAPKRRSPAAW
jgi:hypothetical protein